MIICDKFVFIHLHKSGGTFVNHMMIECIPSSRRVGYHLPYDQLPAAYRHLPVLGTVRNPWSYYVSWYHFQHAQAKPNALFTICSDDRTLDFTGTVGNLVTLESDDQRIDRLIDAVPEHFVNHGLNLTKRCVERLRRSGKGFYSYLHDRMYAEATSPRILKMEGLREQLQDLQIGLRGPESMLVREFLGAVPDLNTSDHQPHQTYYSPDLKALVADRDASLINAYGYGF